MEGFRILCLKCQNILNKSVLVSDKGSHIQAAASLQCHPYVATKCIGSERLRSLGLVCQERLQLLTTPIFLQPAFMFMKEKDAVYIHCTLMIKQLINT